jgi:hypothetical protein
LDKQVVKHVLLVITLQVAGRRVLYVPVENTKTNQDKKVAKTIAMLVPTLIPIKVRA